MKKQFTFSIDTSKGYFWIILILMAIVLFQYFKTPETNNDELKRQNEILVSNERKANDSILSLRDSLKAIRNDNLALKSKLANQKTVYKSIIIEKDAKKNTIYSYDYASIRDAFTRRYHKDRASD